MSSNSPNKRATTSVSAREREKRAAAKARRQAARTAMPAPEPETAPVVEAVDEVVPRQPAAKPRTAAPKREDRPAASVAKLPTEPVAPTMPMGDPHGYVAMWTALVLLAMLGLLTLMIVAAS